MDTYVSNQMAVTEWCSKVLEGIPPNSMHSTVCLHSAAACSAAYDVKGLDTGAGETALQEPRSFSHMHSATGCAGCVFTMRSLISRHASCALQGFTLKLNRWSCAKAAAGDKLYQSQKCAILQFSIICMYVPA